MLNPEIDTDIKLDPWAASSLLQKAIRRGDTSLAQFAAQTLYRQRGAGVWKRLIGIAFEDVGIAEPDLITELTVLATDKAKRAVLADDIDLILDLCQRLADAPKDRSADYLFCAGYKLAVSQRERAHISKLSWEQRVEIATDADQPFLRRAVAAMAACTVDGSGMKAARNEASLQLLAALDRECPSPIHDATALAAGKGCDAIILMVPLLWSMAAREAAPPKNVDVDLPPAPRVGRIPLYTFDKHTSAGKHAVSLFAQENAEVSGLLAEHVASSHVREVALFAAFYADGMPVSRQLRWSQSDPLEELGLEADMTAAGCPTPSIAPIVDAVRRNLDHLNDIRRRVLTRRMGQ